MNLSLPAAPPPPETDVKSVGSAITRLSSEHVSGSQIHVLVNNPHNFAYRHIVSVIHWKCCSTFSSC